MIGAPVLPDETTTVLRGAGVDVDVRRAARVAARIGVAALLVTAIALFWAGAARNAQITALRTQGAPVTVTVTGCQGLMGGSGSNLVGYTCTGSFELGGRHYVETLPGNAAYAPGAQVALVTPRSDPGVLADPASVTGQRATLSVFALPAVLLTVSIAIVGVALGRRRNSGGSFT